MRQEKFKNYFWNLWSKEYINDLFERHVRQKRAQKALLVPRLGEIVLVSEGEKVPRRSWRMGKIVELDQVKRGAIRQCTVQMLSPQGKFITKLKRPPQQLVPLEVDSSLYKFDAEALVPLEGDPRTPVLGSVRTNFQKYSKKELAKFKKDHIWPPYSRSPAFIDSSSIFHPLQIQNFKITAPKNIKFVK